VTQIIHRAWIASPARYSCPAFQCPFAQPVARSAAAAPDPARPTTAAPPPSPRAFSPSLAYGAAGCYPPATTTAGYTRNYGVEINVNLVYSQGTITVVTPVFATLRYYDQKVEIPTSLTVPCNGTGVLDFTPSPDPDNSGAASNVGVTFDSPGV
jgi:hypothetical protein